MVTIEWMDLSTYIFEELCETTGGDLGKSAMEALDSLLLMRACPCVGDDGHRDAFHFLASAGNLGGISSTELCCSRESKSCQTFKNRTLARGLIANDDQLMGSCQLCTTRYIVIHIPEEEQLLYQRVLSVCQP